MSKSTSALARKHLEKRVSPLRSMALDAPPRGWVRAIREALGMTTRQLASRMGVGLSRIPVIENAEMTGKTTLRTLRQAAAAMNCTLIYVFLPNEPLDDILRHRAEQQVSSEIARLDHTMQLENQALRKVDLDAERRRMIESILAGSLRGLWNDKPPHS